MRYLLAVPALLLANSVMASPFDECRAEAFLTQGKISGTYGLNLVTGDYTVEAWDMGIMGSINALGFSTFDRYVYGWSYVHGKPARVNSDFQVEPLDVENIAGSNFYSGDVSGIDNKYYVYSPGATRGLYSIGLDPAVDDYLEMVKVAGGDTMNLRIADLAFHPYQNLAYAVDHSGYLHQIDVESGTSTQVAYTGRSGGYGAAYFDPNGNLYVSKNSDGSIYRIAIDKGDYNAEFFAKGPSSSTNDGFRCALAPITGLSNVKLDFGDAPDSYATSMDANGPRHGISADGSQVHLGYQVDGESDAFAHPLSDDESGDENDDDGVQFVTSIQESKMGIAAIRATGSGFLSAWIDVDQNGSFDESEQVITDKQLSNGKQYVYFDVPSGVVAGSSWARFRYSSSNGLQPIGGAADGEVEDYEVTLLESEVTVTHYPSVNGKATIAFEDNWPHEGDYDMNDLVVKMRTAVMSKPTGVTQVNLTGEISAVGAAYHNGFAVRLPGVRRDQIDIANVVYSINGFEVDFQPVEDGRDEAIFIIAPDVWDYISAGNFCKYFRTEPDCGSDIQLKFEAEIPMLDVVDVELKGVFDPFLFATPGAWHGGHFATAPGRSYEIHLKNYEPTEAFDQAMFDQPGEDASVPGTYYFQTDQGLPWALEIGANWDHPQEYIDIGHAYPYFSEWASSNGELNKYWYLGQYANEPKLFSN